MKETDMNANWESRLARELPAVMHEGIVLPGDDDSTWVDAPRSSLQSALAALSDGRISEAVAQFAERFKFNDHALTLEFTEKTRLTEFLKKARELFPDTALEVASLMESGDHAIAEWKLTATHIIPYGSIGYRIPIELRGSTIVRVEHGRIVQWSDYYDHALSRRMSLASYFTE
jgi:ketosteroid isomerase-like protein